MYVVSASRRTDIPAFYAEWLMNRVRAGFCHWVHPYNGCVYTISLAPPECAGIVFWTRYPLPLLPHLPVIADRGLAAYYMVTITGYPPAIEPAAPGFEKAVGAFTSLAERASAETVTWRYDPIVISEATPPDYHLDRFAAIAARLAGYARRCVYSWLIPQPRVHWPRRHAPRELAGPERHAFLRSLAQCATSYGIQLSSCCSDDGRAVPEIQTAGCIDIDALRRCSGRPTLDPISASQFGKALRGTQRSACGTGIALVKCGLTALRPPPVLGPCRCAASVDIGSDDTCLFGCRYCMATHGPAVASANHQAHNPHDTILHRPAHLATADLRTVALPFPFDLEQHAAHS